ncbi:MAG: hypothetical protein ACOX56_01535 [Acholeplasmataceae bacterium]
MVNTYTVHDDAGYTGPEIMRTELIGRADRTLYVRFVAGSNISW